jgi:DNA-binding LytR/AlgR family response regulator
MNQPQPAVYPRFLPWRRGFEVGFWCLLYLFNAVANSITEWLDIRDSRPDIAAWKPAVWESSSALAFLLLIWPLVWFSRRYPLYWGSWRHELPCHLLFSVVFSLLHVALMVAMRHLAYAVMGGHYDFGNWRVELPYEYLKDVRSYFLMLALLELYRLLLRRLQGEASLLDLPDEGPPLESIERPERFLVRKLRREFLVAADDIEWLQAAGNYVNLRVRGHDYPLRSTITGIEGKLDPARFVRIHRSYIVNLAQLVSIEPLEAGEARVHMKDGTVLPCSRNQRGVLRERLGSDARG